MNSYNVVYLPTGQLVKDKEWKPIVLTGNSERGAKAKYTRAGHYLDWNLHILVEVEK